MPKPHPLTNFEIINYDKKETRFNGVFSTNNLPNKIKNEAYVINLDEYAYIGTYWIALYSKNNEVIYSDSFGTECILEEVKKLLKIKIPENLSKYVTGFNYCEKI